MDDLISRQAAIEALDDNITLTGWGNSVAVRDYILRAKKRLQAIPAAQPERTGKWINDADDMPRCSCCGYLPEYNKHIDDYFYSDFCPMCGARMEDNG